MENQKGLTLTQPSAISTRVSRINDVSQHKAILDDLSLSIRHAIDSPSFNQLKAGGANVKETTQVLAVLILKYANMLTVGGNLRPEHPMQYAESIIQDNPSMSLDDFNILLSNGVKGRYNERGKLFRFDISVIYDWIVAYQEEFWEVKENAPKQKTALEMAPPEVVSQIQDVIMKAPDRIVMPLTEQDVKREGREKPIKPAYRPPDENYIRMQELRAEYGRSCRDIYTGRPIPGKPETFEEWLGEIETKK